MLKYLLAVFLLLPGGTFLYSQCWQKIASRYDHVLGIHVDGTLWTWGGNGILDRSRDTPTLLDAGTNWVEIATGNQFSAAIKADGTLWTWGENSSGQLGQGNTSNLWLPTQVGTESDWKSVSCGTGHTVALKTNGTLWIWGRNNNGQLGLGTNRTNRTIPMQLGTATDWVEISAGDDHTLIRKSDHTLWFVGACFNSTLVSQLDQVGTTADFKTMGAGAYQDYGIKLNGQLWKWAQSNGASTNPTQVGTATNWKQVDNSHAYSQEAHALLLKTNGTLWAIGYNNLGQLGTGTLTYATLPVQVGAAADWKQVVAGNACSFGLSNNASFWAWGRNEVAQFGNGKNRNIPQPVVVPAASWKEVSTARCPYSGHTLAIQENGTLWSWGQNNDGQLGIGTTYTHQPLPVQVGTDANWRTITNGFFFSAAIKTDGTLWTWGRNGRGQLGLNTNLSVRSLPVQVGTDTTWRVISAGSEFVIALKKNGTLWSWGYNAEGQLGYGNTTTQFTPVQIGTDSNWIAVSAGERHSLALRADSTLWSWGSNSSGQVGRGGMLNVPGQVGTSKWIKIGAGGLHSLAIQADSSLWAWGRNLHAELGDDNDNDVYAPKHIGTDNDWIEVSGGYEHSLGLKVDGSLWGWGRNATGQTADTVSYIEFLSKTYVPKQINAGSSWKQIDAGCVNSIGIQTDGSLLTWGDGYVSDYQMHFPQLGYLQTTPLQLSVCNYCLVSTSAFTQSICSGDSVLFNGAYRLQAGNYTDTLINAAGCDSIITMSLLLKNAVTGTDVQTACGSFTWIDGELYTSSNHTATWTLENAATNGCDSIVTLDLTILEPATGTDVQTACVSFMWIDGETYTESNQTATYVFENAAANGCDSIVTLDLMILQPATGTDIQTACVSFMWIDGETYTESNQMATYVFENAAANGCDSIVTLDLTILEPATGTDIQTACVSFMWIDGETYAESNQTATYVFENAAANGCDSIVTLDLTILQPATGTDIQTACVSFMWIDGETYTESNQTATYVFEDAAANGCDSIVTLDLTILQPVTGTDVQTACGAFTWIDGQEYTSDNHTATWLLANAAANGCDSLVTLQLTIESLSPIVTVNGITLQAAETGAVYQWVDCNTGNTPVAGATAQSFTPLSNGNYAVIISRDNCTVTSNCYHVMSVGLEEQAKNTLVQIYPNPNGGQFYIQSMVAGKLKIIDALGRIVYAGVTEGGIQWIDLGEQAEGMYVVQLEAHQRTWRSLVQIHR